MVAAESLDHGEVGGLAKQTTQGGVIGDLGVPWGLAGRG